MRMKVQSPIKVRSLTWYPPEVHSDERDRPPSGGPVNVRSWLVWRCGVSGRLAPPDPLRRPGSKGGHEHLRGWGGRPVWGVETPCCHGVSGSRPHDFGLQL